ncbi:type II toxin-antitoxin system HicB family antitoxin [uncultured Lactobacillus sp.]|uniref:type II toxin-antitoxin system HicB family antitoxin n=1 Tax=uncultured Lactobacillus sp. TaxID=153152 RepID=UPI0026081964|nr:type II toxin-antitoxin system HicB family antitoxin [uncultured Lactobacillus sp.]
MKKELSYKGYYGSVEYSLDDDILFGKVIGINGLLSYEGKTIDELRTDFQDVVDEYLEDCKIQGIKPQKSYKGSFNVRISPELHMKAAIYAASKDESLNSLVEEAIEKYVHD